MRLDEREIEGLRTFLLEANVYGFANESAVPKKEVDGSSTLEYERGKWRIRDNWFGGEPFGGAETVFYGGNLVWIMIYYGRILPEEIGRVDRGAVYVVLRRALKNMPPAAPFRGPKEFLSFDGADYSYLNRWDGDIRSFRGGEEIKMNSCTCCELWFRKVYEAKYSGGVIGEAVG